MQIQRFSRRPAPGVSRGCGDAARAGRARSRTAAASAEMPRAGRAALSGSIASEPVNPNQGDPRIVVLGDSLTAGLGLSPAEAYPALLQQRLRERGTRVSSRQRGHFGRYFRGRPVAARLGARGRRAHSDRRAWRQRRAARPAGRAAEEQSGADHRARAGAPHHGRSRRDGSADRTRAPTTRRRFTRCIPRWRRNTTWRSCRSCSKGSRGSSTLNQRDGIHPNAEGARIVADNVWTVLEPIAGAAGEAAGRRPGS